MSTRFYYHKELQPCTPTRLKYLREQVERLKKMPQPEQRTEEWYSMREDRITASDFATALNQSPYQKQHKLLWKKVTKDRTFNTNSAMSWGIKYEEVAVMIYEYRNSVNIVEYGCIKHPTCGWLGASPDGITDDGVMLEIKCPSSRVITGKIPSYYWCQVQGQLEVCELDRCDFLECKLEEYSSRKEYEEDNYNGDYFLNKLGMEKGVIVEYFNKESKSYKHQYLPLGLRGEQLDKEIAKNKKKMYDGNSNLIFSGIDYWRLMKISCIPIYRNQIWFYESLPIFKELWDKVLYYREEDISELNKYIEQEKIKQRKNKKPRKSRKTVHKKEEKFLFTSISDYVNLKMLKKDDEKNDIFIGIENNDETIENKVADILKGNFVVIDGLKVKIDNDSLFNNEESNKNDAIVIDNSSLKTDKLLFSTKKFVIKQENPPEDGLFNCKKQKKSVKGGFGNLSIFSKKKNYDDEETFCSNKTTKKDKKVVKKDKKVIKKGFGNLSIFSRKKQNYNDEEIFCVK